MPIYLIILAVVSSGSIGCWIGVKIGRKRQAFESAGNALDMLDGIGIMLRKAKKEGG